MLTVEHWPLERLIPYARNPRKNDQAVDRMCAAIREFGFRIPVVARSDGTVVDGHLRLKAAIRLGLPDSPCPRRQARRASAHPHHPSVVVAFPFAAAPRLITS